MEAADVRLHGLLPRAGGRNTAWGMTVNWMVADRRAAFGIATDGSGGVASTNASLYLLVKYLGVPPSLFICKGDRGTTEFKLSDLFLPASRTLADLWDFGPPAESFRHCSYAYHIPYNQYALTTSRDPNLAVLFQTVVDTQIGVTVPVGPGREHRDGRPQDVREALIGRVV